VNGSPAARDDSTVAETRHRAQPIGLVRAARCPASRRRRRSAVSHDAGHVAPSV